MEVADPSSVWIYHERQEAQLCGQHALNNLAQSDVFQPHLLAEIAQQLDAMELTVWAQNNQGGYNSKEYLARLQEGSNNVDAAGNFSIEVLKAALQNQYGLSLPHLSQQDLLSSGQDITEMQGFLCHKSDHWFAIRKIGGRYWNLNSTLERPQLISHFQLATEMQNTQELGYTVFCVPTGLPEGGIKRPVTNKRAHWHRMSDLLRGASTRADPWALLRGAGMRLDGKSTTVPSQDPPYNTDRLPMDGLTEEEMMQIALQESLEPAASVASRVVSSGSYNNTTATKPVPVPPEPDAREAGVVRIQFRMPNNKRVVRRFYETETVSSLYAYVEAESDGRHVELKYGFPPQSLTRDATRTLKEAGLAGESIQGCFV